MTEFARGLLVGLFLGGMVGGLVVAILLLRWWTGALEESAAVVSRASERNERQADPIRRLQAENDALRAGEGVTLRIVVERVGPEAGEAVCSPVGEAVTTLRAGKAAVVAAGDLAALLRELGKAAVVAAGETGELS